MNMRFESLKQELAARHRQALCADIQNLTAVIALFKGKKVTVWHCCDRDGSGYLNFLTFRKLLTMPSTKFMPNVRRLKPANSGVRQEAL